jgi:hypothetical protein
MILQLRIPNPGKIRSLMIGLGVVVVVAVILVVARPTPVHTSLGADHKSYKKERERAESRAYQELQEAARRAEYAQRYQKTRTQ